MQQISIPSNSSVEYHSNMLLELARRFHQLEKIQQGEEASAATTQPSKTWLDLSIATEQRKRQLVLPLSSSDVLSFSIDHRPAGMLTNDRSPDSTRRWLDELALLDVENAVVDNARFAAYSFLTDLSGMIVRSLKEQSFTLSSAWASRSDSYGHSSFVRYATIAGRTASQCSWENSLEAFATVDSRLRIVRTTTNWRRQDEFEQHRACKSN